MRCISKSLGELLQASSFHCRSSLVVSILEYKAHVLDAGLCLVGLLCSMEERCRGRGGGGRRKAEEKRIEEKENVECRERETQIQIYKQQYIR